MRTSARWVLNWWPSIPIPTSCSSTPVFVDMDEVEENEFNLNVPRYVDTFEPELRTDVDEALRALVNVEKKVKDAEATLMSILRDVGYAVDR